MVGSQEKSRQVKDLLFAVLLGILALGMRILPAGRLPESWDSVDFALALERYDLWAMQPHFPGYPIFILMASVFHTFIENEYLSLSLLSAFAGAGTVSVLYLIARKILSTPFASLVACWAADHPLLWITSEQPMSDAFGLFLAIVLVYWTWRQADETDPKRFGFVLVVGSFLYSLLLGVRLSDWPFVFVLLFPLIRLLREKRGWNLSLERVRHLFLAVVVFVCGCLLWIWGASFSEGGISGYFRLGFSFLSGHFTQWGKTAWSEGAEFQRLLSFLEGWWSWGFGGTWIAVIGMAGFLAFFVQRQPRSFRWIWLLWFLPTLIWVYMGQNVEKPRHLLPMIPAVLIALGVVMQALSRRSKFLACTVSLLLLAGFAWQGAKAVWEYANVPSPVYQLAKYTSKQYEKQRTVVFAWEEERVFQVVAPKIDVVRLRSKNVLEDAMKQYAHYDHLLITGSVVNGLGEDKEWLSPKLRLIRSFSWNLRLDPVYDEIQLYEIRKEFLR